MELRNVCFVRHAKSSWENPYLSDIERPLNNRGLRDAPLMGQKMAELRIVPDLLITSSAVRAHATAKHFAVAFGIDESDIKVIDDLYGAAPRQIVSVVNEVADEYQSIYIFGHNPGMTYLANEFAGINIDNVPTCGISQVKTMTSWKDFSPDTSIYVSFYYPKQYIK